MKNSSCKKSGSVPVFEIPADTRAVFIRRPNRFLALVEKDGKVLEAHVHDPGRLPDLLVPGNEVLLKYASRAGRRTSWSLLAGKAEGYWVFANAGYHRQLSGKILSSFGKELFKGLETFSPEPRLEGARLDYLFQMEDGVPVYVEIKGCTWARGEEALFPDAPTVRGQKHLRHLLELKRKGFGALLWILCFRKEAGCFRPAYEIDPEFARLFEEALKAGVEVRVSKLCYDGEKIYLQGELPLC